MIACKIPIIHERSNIIQIPKNLLTTKISNVSNSTNYSLNQSCFDPTKSSPPNKFMINLHMRYNNYTSLGINDDNRERA